MQDFNITEEMINEQEIKETAHTLELINYQIAELTRIKEQLNEKLRVKLGHPDNCQDSYNRGKYKIIIRTGYNYSVNKEKYEAIKEYLPERFNPVRTKQVYEVDKKIIKDLVKLGDKELNEKIYGNDAVDKTTGEIKKEGGFISLKPKKLHVSITAGA